MNGLSRESLLAALLCCQFVCSAFAAESLRRAGAEFNATRPVEMLPGKNYAVIVTDFYHHGEISPDGRNVVVAAKNREIVPMRLLQLGPGDFCRLAFQTIRGQNDYEIFYGGEGPKEAVPPWTSRDGLLLETREYKECNLQTVEAVRAAFQSAKPIGSDYVQQVHHGYNPCLPNRGPFFSHYSGHLDVPAAAAYGFWTASQDCSFLVVDDKLVVSSPGRHGPRHRARPQDRGDAKLSAGLHKFDYYHAATGDHAVMSATWAANPSDKSQPVVIPPDAFRTQRVAHLPAGRPVLRGARLAPDFSFTVTGEVPLPDNPLPLVNVSFRDQSPKPLQMEGKNQWDFGDGQTSTFHNVDHVYLHPGLYAVKLSAKHAGRTVEIVNRIQIDRPFLTGKDKQHTLDDYLRVIENYGPQSLDAVGLRQLLLAYEAKAAVIEAKAEDEQRKVEENEKRMADAKTGTPARRAAGGLPQEAVRWLSAGIAAVKGALMAEQSAAEGDDDLLRLARLAGPIARDRLGDSESALRIWQGVARKVQQAEAKAECEVELADIAINDMVKAQESKPVLAAASAHLGKDKTGPLASRLQRVWGDFYAATGDGRAARAAYQEAERLLGRPRGYAEQTARRGAHGRSTEEFIKNGQLQRAVAEIRIWQQDFPGDKLDGYLTLLAARYFAGRKQYAQAIAQAEQLQAANADSPYLDQVLYLAADCELKRGQRDRCLATLHAMLKDLPGSPLVPNVKKAIAKLEKGDEP